mmetsp:Transcript_28400/g.60206  ORF Transcript_28400/g.60206 Transcript_28400/m.60206 type:complete len:88 (-) Transcript_28400:39-302(-)
MRPRHWRVLLYVFLLWFARPDRLRELQVPLQTRELQQQREVHIERRPYCVGGQSATVLARLREPLGGGYDTDEAPSLVVSRIVPAPV